MALYLGNSVIQNVAVSSVHNGVDSSLSSTSTNPVQNKAIHTALASKADLVDGKVLSSQLPMTTATSTLTVANWSSNTQTVSVTGVTASNTIIVSAAPTSLEAWGNAGIYCSAQEAGKLTFTCSKTPIVAIVANILIMG